MYMKCEAHNDSSPMGMRCPIYKIQKISYSTKIELYVYMRSAIKYQAQSIELLSYCDCIQSMRVMSTLWNAHFKWILRDMLNSY